MLLVGSRVRAAKLFSILLTFAFILLVAAHVPICLGPCASPTPLELVASSFGPGRAIATFPAELNEISGMAESRANANVFWVHNDSGDQPRVFAVSRAGMLLGTYLLQGASAVDWEDMAMGPAPNGGSYLYLADIGDNSARRTSIRVYRVLEPRVDAAQTAVTETLAGVTTFEFVYEDGARDAEAFMIDPLTDEFYVVTKRERDGNRLYRSARPVPGQINTLTNAATFAFTGTTGGDISPDGLQVLIRRYSLTPTPPAATYWSRPDRSVSLVDLLKQPGQPVAVVFEIQGEAIAFSSDNKGFYTTSERGEISRDLPPSPLTFYPFVP
jgi:hypothetical protein